MHHEYCTAYWEEYFTALTSAFAARTALRALRRARRMRRFRTRRMRAARSRRCFAARLSSEGAESDPPLLLSSSSAVCWSFSIWRGRRDFLEQFVAEVYLMGRFWNDVHLYQKCM